MSAPVGIWRNRSAVAQQHGDVDPRVGVEQSALGIGRPAPRELGPRAGAIAVPGHVGEGVANEVAGGGIALCGQALAHRGPEHQRGAAGECAVEPRQSRSPAHDAPRRALAGNSSRRWRRFGMSAIRAGSRRPVVTASRRSPPRCRGRRAAVAGRPPRDRNPRSPRRASRPCTGGGACPRNLHGAGGRAARRGNARKARPRPAPTRGEKVLTNVVMQVLDPCPFRGTLYAHHHDGDRASVACAWQGHIVAAGRSSRLVPACPRA